MIFPLIPIIIALCILCVCCLLCSSSSALVRNIAGQPTTPLAAFYDVVEPRTNQTQSVYRNF